MLDSFRCFALKHLALQTANILETKASLLLSNVKQHDNTMQIHTMWMCETMQGITMQT